MKTKIVQSKGAIVLVAQEGEFKNKNLAAMTLWEGTGCWMVTDVRLTPHSKPNPWAGINSDHIHANYTFVNQANPEPEIAALRQHLRDFDVVTENGETYATWNPMIGVVEGRHDLNNAPDYSDHLKKCGFFTRAEGLTQLRAIQEFWETQADWSEECRITAPYQQPGETVVGFRMMFDHGFARTPKEPPAAPSRPSDGMAP